MPAPSTISLSMPESDIALLTLDMPDKSANILSTAVLAELDKHLADLEQRADLAGVIIVSAKPNIFIAGADIGEFVANVDAGEKHFYEMCRKGHQLFGRLSSGPFLSVVAINGICVGGGAELSVWCDRRIMSNNPKTGFGFPEVKLGIVPGWGGTARLPRIVGLSNAIEMITSGESISSQEALQMGLISDVVPNEKLVEAAIALVRAEQETGQALRDRERWSGPIETNDTEMGFLGITASAYIKQQTKGQYPAPEAALELMLAGAGSDVETACQLEAECVSKLFGSPINRALMNVFFLTDRNKKDKGIQGPVTPREIDSVGVIGAGIMGAGIAAANVKRKVPVSLADAAQEALARGVRHVMEEVSYDKTIKGPNVDRVLEFSPLLNPSTADAELAGCDLLIEAVVENADVKKSIYQRLEPQLHDDAILASNTSTIPITSLADGLKRPERFCGIHFFNPVRRMKLVEVIRGEKTSDETVATAVAHAKRIGKMPVVVNDGPGFLVNRLLFPYMNEALELLAEGASIADIERASKKFGMPMGPITLYDVVGLDTALFAGRVMWEAFPDRIVASPILPALVKAGRLGQKSGAGFFRYEGRNKKGTPDPQLADHVGDYLQDPREFTQDELTNRLFLPMLLEATRALQAEIVRDVRDVDLGLIFGLGFPPFKGGLLFWADTLGAAKIIELLKPLEEFGERMKPTELLLQMAKSGATFYE